MSLQIPTGLIHICGNFNWCESFDYMHFAEGVRIISRKLKRRKWKSPKSAFPMLPIYELIWNTPKKTTFTSYTIINYVINVAQLLNICVMKDILLKLVISVCILLLTEI